MSKTAKHVQGASEIAVEPLPSPIISDDVPEGADEGDLTLEPGPETVVIEKNDRSLSEFHRWFKNGKLVIDPMWQRNYVWDDRRASKLIESFLMDIPVPVVYLAKTDDGKYEVIDGVQRLTSIFNFIDGELTLTGLDLLPDLNKKQFSELPRNEQSKLEDATLRAFELSPKTSKNLLFVIFERLNTGGVALNDMEIRNCIYRGDLNDLIKELARFEPFTECVNQRNLSKRMADRSLVLRFLAFYEKGYNKVQAGLKAFLNEFFETYQNPTDKKIAEFRKKFESAMKAAKTIFGNHGFRVRRRDEHGGGEWGSQVNASILQVIAVSFTDYDQSDLTRNADAIFEEFLDMMSSDVQWVDCVSKSTGDSSRIKYAFETWIGRLREVMKPIERKDSKRAFSRALKEEMWKQNSTCAICSQEIKLVNDAALDHDVHYWRGGKTVPSNARLAHRLCNNKRPKKDPSSAEKAKMGAQCVVKEEK